MCGITGFINDSMGADEKRPILTKMMDAIKHRGPDSGGQAIDENSAIGMRRLSIIDVHEGKQPIYNEDKSKVITFNGEIYNFQEIRDALVAAGHKFTTHTDTEVILHGYEEYGTDILKKLRGMFAFVIYDYKTKELFGARDPFGIKPFYYSQMGDTFMYGSEIKSFLQHPDFKKELNKQALKPYMTFQYSALNETFFKGVYKLQEGHYFIYRDGVMDIHQYFDYEAHPSNESLSEITDEIDNAVVESVKAHSITDSEVKTGAFLSSGVDSSYVASVLKPHTTYSVGFDRGKVNEINDAEELAKELGVNMKSETIDANDAFSYFAQIQYYLDEPDSNFSCIPLFFLSRLAAKDVKVAMSGEGADELFGGYQAYGFWTKSRMIRLIAEALKKLPRKTRKKIADSIRDKDFRGKTHLYTSIAPAEDFFIGDSRVFEPEQADEFLQEEYQSAPTIQQIIGPTYEKVEDQTAEIRKMQYLDLHHFMPGDILLKADKMSMAASLEVRVPILDTEVAKVSEKVPTKYMINSKNTKYAFRQAAKRHLPKEWYNREKLGFPTPIRDWLHEEKYYKIVRDEFSQDYVKEFFKQDKLLKMLDDYYDGKNDSRKLIWNVYTFLTWYKVYFINDGEKPEVAEL